MSGFKESGDGDATVPYRHRKMLSPAQYDQGATTATVAHSTMAYRELRLRTRWRTSEQLAHLRPNRQDRSDSRRTDPSSSRSTRKSVPGGNSPKMSGGS